jgi:hypothetical protein
MGSEANKRKGHFASNTGVSLSTLDYHRRRNRQQAKARVPMARVKVEPEASPARFALRLANGRRIPLVLTDSTLTIVHGSDASGY